MIAIIGGGVAGLVAAINLENSGLECMIIEKQSYLGGRVGTDLVNEVPLDHGFQVLLTDYPYAHKYLDYSKLDLNTFSSGAVIYKDGRKNKFGDPIRNLSMLLPMLSSWVGTFSDKLKIYNLSRKLGLKSVESIFEESETTTLSYLQSYGFSKKVIDNFFKPFFGGIFLESELSTSSRMFEFVFKMFAYGSAAVPKKGMQEIPKQLRECLKKTKFVLGTSAEIAENGEVMVDGKAIAVRGIVKAYAEKSEWNGCSTLYYKVNQRILEGKIIGLLVDKNTVINSFHYVTDGILSVNLPLSGKH